MKNATLLLVSALLILGGCSTTRSDISRSIFTFSYQGDTYEIISLVIPAKGGSNFLLLRQDEQVLLRAKDQDQDGTLDTLLIGDMSLESANHIYAFGIAEAQARGKYKERVHTRRFTLARSGYTYIIQTYLLGSGGSYNTFTLIEAITGAETVAVDADADGVLDEVDHGEKDLETSQNAYAMVLKEGLREGRIVLKDGSYLVLPKAGQRPL